MIFRSVVLMVLFFIANNVFASLVCSNCKSKCIMDGGTRYFDGVAVTLDCWGYVNAYDCSEQFDNDYQQLEKTIQDEKVICLSTQSDETKDIICAEDIFLDPGKIVSSVAILKAAKEIGSQGTEKAQIFSGRHVECSENILPGISRDCCGISSGFLEGKILHCTEEELDLAKRIEKGLAVQVGGYCYKGVLGICTSYHKAYCVFDSKIARIVQDYGRKKQLGIDFGEVGDDYARLNCRGITKEELEIIEFDKIDFSPIYSDIYDLYNEEVQPARRICGKIPYVTLIDEPYPGCRRHVSPGSIEDCLAGEVQVPSYHGDGHGKITVPKNRGSRVTFGDCRHGYYYVTIVNEATGQHVVPSRTRVDNGKYIELPFSRNQDQTFRFIAHRSDGCSCNQAGSLHVYFNYLRKIPKVEWKEELCRDV